MFKTIKNWFNKSEEKQSYDGSIFLDNLRNLIINELAMICNSSGKYTDTTKYMEKYNELIKCIDSRVEIMELSDKEYDMVMEQIRVNMGAGIVSIEEPDIIHACMEASQAALKSALNQCLGIPKEIIEESKAEQEFNASEYAEELIGANALQEAFEQENPKIVPVDAPHIEKHELAEHANAHNLKLLDDKPAEILEKKNTDELDEAPTSQTPAPVNLEESVKDNILDTRIITPDDHAHIEHVDGDEIFNTGSATESSAEHLDPVGRYNDKVKMQKEIDALKNDPNDFLKRIRNLDSIEGEEILDDIPYDPSTDNKESTARKV